MKRDDKLKLMTLSAEEAKKKIGELQLEILQARQERALQDKKTVDIKRPFKLRKQIALLKTQLRSYELENL